MKPHAEAHRHLIKIRSQTFSQASTKSTMQSLSKILLFTCLSSTASFGLPELPIPSPVNGDLLIPAIFLIEEDGGDAALSTKAIQIANTEYYNALMKYLQSEPQTEKLSKFRLLLDHRASEHILPVWAENIIVRCRPSELIVAFYPRNAGWSVLSGNRLAHSNVLAYTCVIDTSTWKTKNPSHTVEAVNFRNFYENLRGSGLVTEYPDDKNVAMPLNKTGAMVHPNEPTRQP